jgi:hypothetical protein
MPASFFLDGIDRPRRERADVAPVNVICHVYCLMTNIHLLLETSDGN